MSPRGTVGDATTLASTGQEAPGSNPGVPNREEPTPDMDPEGAPASDPADAHLNGSRPLATEPVDERVTEWLVWMLGSATRARIFAHLRTAPGRTSGEIAEETDLYPSTVREMVASMHDEGLLRRSKRSLEGRGNNPFEYTAIPPTDLVERRAPRLQDGLNAIYGIDRRLPGAAADTDSEPVRITVRETVDD